MAKNKRYISIFLIFFAFLLMTDTAMAAGDLTSVTSRVTNQLKSMGGLMQIGGMLVGFILLLVGINSIIQAKKQQQGLGIPIATVLVGVALLSAMTLAQVGSQSTFGEDGGVSTLLSN